MAEIAQTDPESPEGAVETPYSVGEVLVLDAALGNSPSSVSSKLSVRVKEHAPSWTLSCGMVVEIVGNTAGSTQRGASSEHLANSSTAFLKLFDRRFAYQLRNDERIEPWSENVEEQLIRSVQSGKTEMFLHRLNSDTTSEDSEDDEWDDAENEAFLWSEQSRLFDAEVETYSRLQEYQGELVPRFLAQVTLHIWPSGAAAEAQGHVKGILIEYLPGFSLRHIPQHCPQSSWRDIVYKAVEITRVIGDNSILNKDVRIDNFVVVPKGEGYQVYMIDFGLCRFRKEDEPDKEWGKAKWTQDEEGAVGAVMSGLLKRTVGFELEYKPSSTWLEWAPGENG